MPLDFTVLGTALNEKAKDFNDRVIDQQDLEGERLAFWRGVAEEIVNHIKANALVTTTGTATSHTGNIS